MINNRYAKAAVAQGMNAAMQPQRPQYGGLGASAFGPTPMIQPEQMPGQDLGPANPDAQKTLESRKAILSKAMGK